MNIYMIATLLTMLTGHCWQAFIVHGIPAVCAITQSAGQLFANGCHT